MLIGGKKPALDQREIVFRRTVGEPVRLRLTALPIGVEDRYNRELRRPEPPFRDYARDPQTKGFLYDGEGRLIPTYNDRDPKYLEAARRRNRLWSVCMIVESLRNDASVTFDAKREECKTTEEWAEALWAEFQESGLAMGEFGQLLDAVMGLSGLRGEEMESARADFSARGASAPDGSSPTTQDEPNDTGSGVSGNGSE